MDLDRWRRAYDGAEHYETRLGRRDSANWLGLDNPLDMAASRVKGEAMDQEETDYEVQENHSLARGFAGGAVITALGGGIALAWGVSPWVGIIAVVFGTLAWDQYRYRG